SVAAAAELLTVKETIAAAASDALCMVIWPDTLLTVTLVDLLVACVTVPPAPVAYPTPALGSVLLIAPLTDVLVGVIAPSDRLDPEIVSPPASPSSSTIPAPADVRPRSLAVALTFWILA